ncbi:TetR/AcrR family transcriptional regulator [Pedobacter sp. L105]|uniref:TetR/AcrR family transcriptional regulator n=1 Tax=Pedobacter sp. L105 TaxID=1641871 RepID=UPI0020B14FAB|nr:TetR/AcrR family transcriptional regulator [Pedobacter sp. L105]
MMNKAEKTRQFIIEKTAPLFNTNGVAGTAVSDIMAATKMARGSLYVHFQNIDELVNCVVDYNLKMFVERTTAVSDQHESAKNKFFALLDYLSDPLNPPVQGGCPMMNFGMEADDTNPVIREKVNEVVCGVQQAMENIIQKGINDGEFQKEWDAGEFATKSYAMIEGGILISRVSRDISKMKMLVRLLKEEINEHSI